MLVFGSMFEIENLLCIDEQKKKITRFEMVENTDKQKNGIKSDINFYSIGNFFFFFCRECQVVNERKCKSKGIFMIVSVK